MITTYEIVQVLLTVVLAVLSAAIGYNLGISQKVNVHIEQRGENVHISMDRPFKATYDPSVEGKVTTMKTNEERDRDA